MVPTGVGAGRRRAEEGGELRGLPQEDHEAAQGVADTLVLSRCHGCDCNRLSNSDILSFHDMTASSCASSERMTVLHASSS